MKISTSLTQNYSVTTMARRCRRRRHRPKLIFILVVIANIGDIFFLKREIEYHSFSCTLCFSNEISSIVKINFKIITFLSHVRLVSLEPKF